MKNISIYLAATLAALTVTPAFAASNVGGIAQNLGGQVNSIGKMVMIICAVAGVVVALFGLLKFKAHSANPNDPSNKISSAVTLLLVGAAMVAIPELLGSGISTIFGDSAKTTTGGFGFTPG